MIREFPLWCRSRLPPIHVLSTPAELAAARLNELCRRRTDNEKTPRVEVKSDASQVR